MKLCDYCQKVEVEDGVSYCSSCAAYIIKIGMLQQSLQAKPEEAKQTLEDIKEECKDEH